MTVSVSIRLDEDLSKALDEVAAHTDRPKTYLINKALRQFIDEYADYQIALDRLRDKDDEVISAAELRNRLG